MRLAFLSSLLCASVALASPRPVIYGDLGSGVSVPVGLGEWHHRFEQSYKFVFRAGIEWLVHRRVSLAPELALDVVAQNPRDSTYWAHGLDARYTRTRATIGGRLGIVFPHGAFYLRAGIGLDFLSGWTRVRNEPRMWDDALSVAFSPALGISAMPIKQLAIGLWCGPTIANYDLGDGAGHFTAVDIDVVITIGGRL